MPIRMAPVAYDVVELRGGFDQLTPTLSLKPGVCRDALNFECAPTGGYSRIGGYERYSGLAKPSDATYTIVQVTSFTNVPSVGQTLTGATSAATGYIAAVVSGSNYMVLTQVVGTFTTSEAVAVGATPIGTATPQTVTISALLAAQYQNTVADVYRALIAAVPGSGSVLGVVGLIVGGVDKLYAWRNNAGGTAAVLHVASGPGWTAIALGRELSFTSGGVTEIVVGNTITGATSAATAVITRVCLESGSWAAGTAAGRFIFASQTGTFQAENIDVGATLNLATIAGDSTAITMSPGGKFEFAVGNLAGAAGILKIYGADGVNRGHEFDGTTFAPISTGAATDTPAYVTIHKNHLMWLLRTSLMSSGPALPFTYTSVAGGSEISIGDTGTGFLIQPGGQTTGALAVYGRNSTSVLYGTSASDWNLTRFVEATGALAHSAQNMNQSYVLDDSGVISLATTLNYGNFAQATLTAAIQTFITNERSKTNYSSVSRDKSQYRVFFSDGYGLYITIVNGKLLGSMPVLFPDVVNVAWEGELANGNKVSYFGDTSGFVHQMDVGSSFDGDAIDAYITLNWNAMRSPRLRKRFRHASVEMTSNYYAAIQFGYQLGYGTTEITQPISTAYASAFSPPPNWDSFTWDDFTWDGRTLFPTEVDVRGTGENLQVTISSTTDYIYPFTVTSVISHYTPRRGMR